VNPLHSVGARLTLAFLLVVSCAMAIVYLVVVPPLQDSLIRDRLDQLERDAHIAVGLIDPTDSASWPSDAENIAAVFPPTRVSILLPTGDGTLDVYGDSGNFRSLTSDPVALAAVRFDRIQRGTVNRGTKVAEVAVPLRTGAVLLIGTSLGDTLRNVSIVRRRLLLATVLALVVSVGVGFGAARIFARRLARLERAADHIAAGNLQEPVVDRSRDEIGQVAAAMDRMRAQLVSFDSARGEFIANASHELRTPLFALSGFLELLVDEDLDEATRGEFLQQMREQVSRLTKLATDLLDLSRLDAGAITVDAERVDLAHVAETLVAEFGPASRVNDHLLTAFTDDQVPALGDEERVLQIGRALVENAIRHTPPGTRIAVRATTDGLAPCLEVENGGPMIPDDAQEHIFERFFRLDTSRASGSGLGLAIARQLAELMGGTLELDSTPSRTVFRLVLPAGAAAWQQPAPALR
jgi:two-component system OmpR family sensor kinase